MSVTGTASAPGAGGGHGAVNRVADSNACMPIHFLLAFRLLGVTHMTWNARAACRVLHEGYLRGPRHRGGGPSCTSTSSLIYLNVLRYTVPSRCRSQLAASVPNPEAGCPTCPRADPDRGGAPPRPGLSLCPARQETVMRSPRGGLGRPPRRRPCDLVVGTVPVPGSFPLGCRCALVAPQLRPGRPSWPPDPGTCGVAEVEGRPGPGYLRSTGPPRRWLIVQDTTTFPWHPPAAHPEAAPPSPRPPL